MAEEDPDLPLPVIHVPTALSEQRILGIQPRPPSLTRVDGALPQKLDIDDQTLTLEQLATRYKTSLDTEQPQKSSGLSARLASERLAEHGPNALPPPPRTSPAKQFLTVLFDPLNTLLIIAAVISLGLYATDTSVLTPIYLGVLLIIVTLGNASIDFAQAQASNRVLNSFKDLCAPQSYVVRDGTDQQILASEIVPGDIVKVSAGNKIPADIRMIWTNGMKVDNSALTGEGEALKRDCAPCSPSLNYLEARCLSFFGTTMVEGTGLGVAIRTGEHTTMGKIAGMTSNTKQNSSPLHQEIHMFVKLVAIISIVVGLIFFAGGMAINPDFVINFVFFVGVFVAFIPQGLPSTVSIMLTYAAKKLTTRNVLVKDLHAVDTLGTITLLASDKTGTITQNRMTVVRAWTVDFGPGGVNMEESGGLDSEGRPTLRETTDPLVLGVALCSTSTFDRAPENLALPIAQRATFGDATESGLLRFAADRVAVEELREKHPVVFSIPFNSRNKWHVTIHRLPHDEGEYTMFLKGASERVVARCATFQEGGVAKPIDDGFMSAFETARNEYASSGQRVLAFSSLPLAGDAFPAGFEFTEESIADILEGRLNFLGLFGIRDPPKEGVADAIGISKAAGIRVMMVTGDHAMTAHAIAKQVNIITGPTRKEVAKATGVPVEKVPESSYDAEIVTSDQLGTFSEREWSRVLSKSEVVFARASPEQKLEIVTRCQLLGHVVGVTGDGVNDAPALKRADMGISMGISGSDVSKEAAAMILMDDSFPSIVHGIEEGRLIFTNLKKAIQFTLAHILPELIPFLLFEAVGLPVAINSLLVLVVDLGTDLIPALSFSYEAAEDDIMHKPPRKHVTPEPVVVLREEIPDVLNVPSFRLEEVDLQDPANDHLRPRGHKGVPRLGFSRCCGDKATGGEKDEILVDKELMLWSYLQTGVVTTIASLCSYFLVFHLNSVDPSDLMGAAREHFSTAFDKDFVASDGTVLNKAAQADILSEAQSAYFFTLVICQMATAYVLKVRNGLPFGAKMFRNRITYYAMACSVVLALVCVHTPGLNHVLSARPFKGEVYGVALGGFFAVVAAEVMSRKIRSRYARQ